jgi:hypothetical protein
LLIRTNSGNRSGMILRNRSIRNKAHAVAKCRIDPTAIADRREKLVKQIAVSGMDLDH